jgi:hypothetical protein
MAKTVMGYSAQEMIAQIRQQGIPGGTPPGAAAHAAPPVPPAPMPPPPPPPMMQPAVQQSAAAMNNPVNRPAPKSSPLAATIAPSQMPPELAATIAQKPSSPAANMVATVAPQPLSPPPASNMAATIAPSQMTSPFAPPAGNPGVAVGGGPSTGAALGTGPGSHGPGPGPGPTQGKPVIGGGGVLTGSQPIVVEDDKPKLATPAQRPSRPAAPRTSVATDALHGPVKGMLLVASLLLLLLVVVPISVDPLLFPFQTYGDLADAGVQDLIFGLLPGIFFVVGLLVALLAMPTMVKGLVALLLGLAGIATLIRIGGFDAIGWQAVVAAASQVLVLGGLVIRSHYHDSMAGRILATLGVLALLATWLVPINDGIPLTGLFDQIGADDTATKVSAIIYLIGIATTVLGLLAWLPGSSSGGAGVIAWLVLLCTIGGVGMHNGGLSYVAANLAVGDIGESFKQPITLLAWVPITAFLGLAGWGLAGMFGKPAA